MHDQSLNRRANKLIAWANGLTAARALVGVPLVIALRNEWLLCAWTLLLFAGISDCLDGLLARKAGLQNEWGEKFDPLSDKILLSAALIWLCSKQVLPFWSVWGLLARELIVTGWRAQKSKGGAASKQGKIKTILQFISVLLMIWPYNLGGIDLALRIRSLGWFIFWPSFIMALSSCLDYFRPQSTRDP